ncbi:hypothetical protein ABN306_21630 [Providencia huaxiensis]|uniref:Uncharacterized protein n=1 Tax=Providencia huaxiensis TaxID=2027290 RepID=A0A345LRT8_9GAMM|nr:MULTISPECIES: hypothetical protein [Providencia]MCW2255685.1 hypothetical protein [Providencia alcalifaciens]AXH60828.1 hypothetical protein CYG50_01660 [Providencia huaxiensis]MBN6363677.1 hypothetical protein [Providencia huaxiensis]MBQ0266730.1 hypothetical protein [Providencia huaxiensis]MBZ3680069.1 hypothetical protein [Providencia rettgeri]
MSNEILFPIKKLPQFEDILNSIVDGFNDFSLSTKQLTIGISAKKGLNLLDKFIYIHDHQYDYFCWISFNFIEENLRDIDDIEYPYMVSVSTRGESNLKFSVLILYIISSSLNSRVIYDDAYLIQAKEPYPSSELKLFVERYIQDLYSIN